VLNATITAVDADPSVYHADGSASIASRDLLLTVKGRFIKNNVPEGAFMAQTISFFGKTLRGTLIKRR
jgi:hypothetical protein